MAIKSGISTYSVNANDERLVRDDLDARVVHTMERIPWDIDLSDGAEDVTINTDTLIRMVQAIARAEAIRAHDEFGHTLQELISIEG